MKIAAFNVQRLGWTKVNNEVVRDIIIKIMSQYSVVLLVEVMDKTGGDAMELLLQHLNDYGDNSNRYRKLCSKPLGPEGHQEKFVYFYREKEVQILDSYQYVEKNEDVITRQPFAVLLKCRKTVVQDLVLIPVHTKPRNAEAELNALHGVVEDVREKWENDNIMILGDFNADGQHLSKRKKKTLPIFLAPYHSLIGDDVDTTTCNNNDHTYDRIVVYGESMLEAIVPDSAKAYNFREHLNLTEEKTQSVSDHYPVEVELMVKSEVEQMEEQMGKLELKQKAQRKRNPVRPSTGGRPPGAQKKKAGPAATKGRGA
ncbi:deoxyribonuclease-1-like 1 [Pseudochaenichthys georgianus]|uniref:deoxyribonuclease-1-like 1 n=1 Tax=Pseudochaenichthys georgianus TaxID=52239 RepID=UPI00146B1E5F|nr:deoxyribonuclease-1-like 1 [Pseudochaenichthys georgianus]